MENLKAVAENLIKNRKNDKFIFKLSSLNLKFPPNVYKQKIPPDKSGRILKRKATTYSPTKLQY
ncbi:hypothetical protein, partial [Flavobacterium sp. 3-210]